VAAICGEINSQFIHLVRFVPCVIRTTLHFQTFCYLFYYLDFKIIVNFKLLFYCVMLKHNTYCEISVGDFILT
jgi:hypothetical protein